MGIKKFIETLKTFDGLDTSKLTPEQEKEIEKKLEEKVYEASETADDKD